MARPRIPTLYGIFQFFCRLLIIVIEVCALAALIILSRYNDTFPIGFAACILGVVYSMAELVTLANSTHQIPRLRTACLVLSDLILLVLGAVSFFYVMIRRGWRPHEGSGWPRDDPFRDEKAVWTPWYIWMQLAAAILHLMYMMMHCIDACRYTDRRSRRRRRAQVRWGD